DLGRSTLPTLWGVRTRSSRSDEYIFMDESAEDVAALKVLERQRGRRVRQRIIWCAKTQTAMRPAPIVVTDEDPQHSFEMAAVDDEQMVETLPPHGADPSLSERVGHGRSHRRADDLGPDGAPDVVTGPTELGVAIADQVADNNAAPVHRGDDVAGLLS